MSKDLIQKKKNGYSLIELMVSVTIFSIVLVASLGAILAIIDANRKAQAISNVMNNLNAAVEEMTRTIKTGKDYSISIDSISVQNSRGDNITYSLTDDNTILKEIDGSEGQQSLIVTAPEVTITNLSFTIGGDEGCSQPFVYIEVGGQAGPEEVQTDFSIQTAISQRELNIDSCIQ